MASKSFFLRGCKAIDKNKKSYKEKAEETYKASIDYYKKVIKGIC